MCELLRPCLCKLVLDDGSPIAGGPEIASLSPQLCRQFSCPSPLSLPPAMSLKSPGLAVRRCACMDSNGGCLVAGAGGTPSPVKRSRSTARTALVELKTDSNIHLLAETLSVESSPLKFSSPKLGRKQSTASVSKTRSHSPSAEALSPSLSPSGAKSRLLHRSRSWKRSFSDCDEAFGQCSSDSKENDESRKQQPMVASPFKRKRPPKLQIPVDAEAVNPAQQTKDRKDVPAEVSAEGKCFAVYSKKGRRELLEDTYQAISNLGGSTQQAFFGIFDGHGGRNAAEFAAAYLAQNISEALSNQGCDLETAVRLGYLATDSAFVQKKVSSGTSCVTASVSDGSLVVANAGDCRAVLSQDGKAVALTRDHRFEREDERRRVEDLGAYVDCFSGVWRLQGSLAVSRGIGDIHLKEWVCAEPDTQRLLISPDCDFLVLASDGLWDLVSNQEAVDCVRQTSGGLLARTRKLAQLAVARGSMDDVSVLLVDLSYFCKNE